jgi:hypothetical protein
MPTTGIRAGANASDTRLSIVPEAAWGTTPTTPAFQNIRFTSENLQAAKETVRSQEIRPDRNVTDEIMVGRSVSGNMDFELSYGTFDNLLESLFHSEWTGDDDEILINGANIGQSFTAERTIKLNDGSSHYSRFTGLVVNSMSLSIASGALVTGSFDLMGKFGGAGTTALSGATYANANQARVLNAATHFAGLTMTGLSGDTPLIQSIELNITNNLRAQRAVGSIDNVGMGAGQFEVTGTITAYFRPGLLTAFLDHTDIGLEFTLGTAAASSYKFTIPSLVLTGSPGGNADGNDSDLMSTVQFTAVLDRTGSPIGGTIKIEKV